MKKRRLLESVILCGTLILSGCSTNQKEESSVQDSKKEKVEEKDNSIETRSVTKKTFTSQYVPISYADGYLLGADGTGNNYVSVVLNTDGELLYSNDIDEGLTSVVNGISENKDETYFITGANGEVGLLDTDFNKVYKGSEFMKTTGNGFYGYKDGKPCYMDSNFKVKKTFDNFYNMLWNDQYLIKGGAYSQNTTYDYDKTENYFGTNYPRIYDCSTSKYKAENDYGEVYDLDENLLVRLDSTTVPYTWANYILLGENMILEQPGSENAEHEDMASIRILDFDLKEQEKIAGAYDRVCFSEPGFLDIVIVAGDKAADSRKGTLSDDLEPGVYLYDIEKRKLLSDTRYPHLGSNGNIGTEEEPLYEYLDDNGERLIDDLIVDFVYIPDSSFYVVKREDEKCALINRYGVFLEDFSNTFSIVRSKYDEKVLYYNGREVNIDDIRTNHSNAADKGYILFSIKSDEYRETMSTEPMQYDNVVYILE